ncbi:MAG: tRNA (guanosine(37)-N1)-methyltransferase TrmD [Candidatus Aminicenantes bacterium]|nr:tRNA (guanosine(37)-N1)-methyltransferase TrmD [Candidatus Aminicenantes bacterium]
MRFDIITIFPEMFESYFSRGVIEKAIKKEIIEVCIHNLRDYARDKHKQVDDRPFGGNQGMVIKPEPVFHAVEAVKKKEQACVCLLSPKGKNLTSQMAKDFTKCPQIILICGRYEGVDERIAQYLATHEISIGDFVLTGGELAAMVFVDSVSRFLPGVVGKRKSVEQDSFSSNLLDHPQYTRPRSFRGMEVPEVLFSGDHKKIRYWRQKKAFEKTLALRPDLLECKKTAKENQNDLEQPRTQMKGKDNESN